MPEIWIQIENRPWDLCPHPKDRMSGMDVKDLPGGTPPVNVTLHSTTGHSRTVKMHKPVRGADGKVTDALILRRYKPPQNADGSDAWTIPDDRKVNPWDLNEMNPGENGTMGTIPGPVIECNIDDQMIVHFRNNDMRLAPSGSKVISGLEVGGLAGMAEMEMTMQRAEVRGAFTLADSVLLQAIGNVLLPRPKLLPALQRTHSLHPHGFTFAPEHDGAYPLSPPDTAQLITPVGGPDEKAAWESIGVTGHKKGDRVPPGGTFIYRWSGHSWPTTAGVWLYHDHSVCDMENVQLGAIGIIVIHNPAEPGDVTVTIDDLPDKSFVGNPISPGLFSLAVDLPIFKHDLTSLVAEQAFESPASPHEMEGAAPRASSRAKKSGKPSRTKAAPREGNISGHESDLPQNRIEMGAFTLAVNKGLDGINRLFIATYRTPPAKAQYLQLFHMFADNMCINGRLFLGNTPTMVAGPQTKMRFGVVGMGSEPHTFHIHGHRWVIPGPARVDDSTLQFGGPMNSPTSQFEDTRLLGPANSFVFTIDEGNGFMRAADQPIGEWHMHCHLLGHMMAGMMGSLLVVNGGQIALTLPVGKPCPTMPMPAPPAPTAQSIHIKIQSAAFGSQPGPIHVGDTVIWDNKDGFDHTVSADDGTFNLPSPGNSSSAQWVASRTGTIPYHCNIHTDMHGSITVT